MRTVALAAMLLAASATPVAASAAETVREWNFEVLLDGKPIGEHRFTVATDGDRATVRSRARFDVKVLGFTAYRYRHEADEIWRKGCVESIRARTDDDGEVLKVDAEPVEAAGLRVTSAKGVASYPGCVMGFGYWNPAMLQQSRLLNVQTGEYLAVVATPLPDQTVVARGDPVPARRWKLVGPDNPVELWYGTDGQWLALESTVAGGRKLRYRLR
ncbi:hypothetical protein GN316_04075 [Xylophilus sp. Kf1]|nr:hypothetical protein [Xylophilus sp. Kf1]